MEVTMQKWRSFLLITVFILVGTYILLEKEHFFLKVIDRNEVKEASESEITKIIANKESKELNLLLDGDLFQLMDQTSNDVKKELGEPIRKDPTPYGYTWWVYTDEENQYILVGIENDKVQTIYA